MKTLLSLLVASTVVACVGGIEEPPVNPVPEPLETPDGDGNDNGDNPAGGDLTAAKALFDSGVYSTLKAKCGAAGCHSESGVGGSITKFVADDPARGWQVATNYSALVSFYVPSSAPVLTKIEAGHESVTNYTDIEETAITAWLNKELELRNGQPTQPTGGGETLGAAAERVMQQFAGCLNVDDFLAVDFGLKWGNKGSEEGQCEQCHSNGYYGALMNNDNQKMHRRLTMNKYEFLMYFTPDLTGGPTAAKMVPNRASFYGVAEGLDPHREHPEFNANDDDEAILALKSLYDLTQARVASGTGCIPGALTN
jgi:hypothetical protein